MHALTKNLKYAVRMLMSKPTFTLVAVLSLGFGIGANTTIFSVINELFLRPMPVEAPSGLVNFYTVDTRNQGQMPVSHLNWKDIRDQNQTFQGVGGYDWTAMSLAMANQEPRIVLGQLVSGNYFEVLGVNASLGRTFTADEDRTLAAHPIAVLSHGFWSQELGADQDVVGKTLSINNHPFTVIGVAAEGFGGLDVGVRPELWVPMMMHPVIRNDPDMNWYEERRGLFISAFGRLQDNKSVADVQANLDVIAANLEREYPNENGGRSFEAIPLSQANLNPQIRQAAASSTGMLMAVVGLVLLIACANVANLMLIRASERRQEIAVRLSLGASRGQLVNQLLIESLVISLLGGAFGLLIAHWSRHALAGFIGSLPLPVTIDARFAIDLPVLLFALALALATGLIFGLLPALQASRPELVAAIKGQSEASVGESRKLSWRNVLVVAQVALSLIALCGTGLFVRSLAEAQRTDPGFESETLLAMNIDVGLQGYSREQGEEFYRQVKERFEALPGVEAASFAQAGPMQQSFLRSVTLENAADPEDRTLVQVNVVGPDYFQTLEIPILDGRTFSPVDRRDSIPSVIINQTMAQTFWPDRSPIGQRFSFFGDEEPVTVIGVAQDIKYVTLGENPQPYAYQPFAQRYSPGLTLIARTQGDPSAALPATQRILRELDAKIPVTGVSTIHDLLANALWAARAGAVLLSVFGALALIIAGIGLYGVMSYSVTRRRREIGIRMALGARQSGILNMILVQGLILVALGLTIGFAMTFLVTRQIAGLLFVSPTDPVAFTATAGILIAVALLASFLPARRATAVDPIRVLRHE